jgi:hypothetical protein
MSVLSGDQRRVLERAVVAGRGVAEGAAAAVVSRLGVGLRDAPGHLSESERSLRVALRARARQLGDALDATRSADVRVSCPLLAAEVAYEQWHRFLFARFLEANVRSSQRRRASRMGGRSRRGMPRRSSRGSSGRPIRRCGCGWLRRSWRRWSRR